MEVAGNNSQYFVVSINSLLKRMLSHKALICLCLIFGIFFSILWGFLLYKPVYNLSVSYDFLITPNSILEDIYGVKYLLPDNFISMIKHTNTASEFLEKEGISDKELSVEQFFKHITVKNEGSTLFINIIEVKGNYLDIYKKYIIFCLTKFNSQCINTIVPLLESARAVIDEELQETELYNSMSESVNTANYQFRITLYDRIKTVDNQVHQIKNGTIDLFSDYEVTRVSSRAKNMIIIVFVSLFIGIAVDFLISICDTHIYFSEDFVNDPFLGKKLFACIPLYENNRIALNEYRSIISKLPEDVENVSISELSFNAGAFDIAKELQRISSTISINYSGCFFSEADILSGFEKNGINLIVLRAGIDTIEQVRNIARDCRIKKVDNYYFILYGLDISDRMVILFEEKSKYIRYPYWSLLTLRQHYKKYHKIMKNDVSFSD